MNKKEVLGQCRVEGFVIKLPDISLDRKLYVDVAKTFELAGGKWNRKSEGFLFKNDPTLILNHLKSEDSDNLKKEYQFFATPGVLAGMLVELAMIQDSDIILEPSAGQGAIIEAILKKNENANILAIELMPINSQILTQKGFHHEVGDFLTFPNQPIYDKIIANPPFSKNQDIVHIMHMYELLKKGGRLVSLASTHWKNCDGKKEENFKEWLTIVGAKIIDVPSGSFKESGTNVASCIIIINK